MKIKDPSSLPAMTPAMGRPAAKPAEAAPASSPATHTSATNAHDTIRSAMRMAEGQRASRMREVEAAVKAGTYRPDAGRIAERILASAELDAQLRAVLAFP